MEGLIYTLIAAAASGLAFLAYRHPRGYEKFSWMLVVIIMAGFFLAVIWDFAIRFFYSELSEFVMQDKHEAASLIFDKYQLIDLKTGLIIGGVNGYIGLLNFLPKIIELDEKSKEVQD